MGPVKTFLNLQMSILTPLPPSQESAPALNNKLLPLTVLLVMMPENKQKSINNNLLWKNEPLKRQIPNRVVLNDIWGPGEKGRLFSKKKAKE